MSGSEELVRKAIEARTEADAIALQSAIERAIGTRHQRPLLDSWGNWGALTGGAGSYDHKVIEVVTNMQDAVVELKALQEFGTHSNVPYQSPVEAARALFADQDYRSLASAVSVGFFESDPPASLSKRMTIVNRDTGTGLTPEQVPETIFALAVSKKSVNWLQGAFGLGSKTTYRNAKAVVLVTRRDPCLLKPDEEDRITVAVVQWERTDKTKAAFYLVETDWRRPGDRALPFSVPASTFPDFKPGTHLALISYSVEGIHVGRLAQERSFDTVLNTRLYEPVLPVRFTNNTTGGRGEERSEYLRGLRRLLDDNRRDEWLMGHEVLPFSVNGQTYHLPISYWVFAAPTEPGQRRRYVSHGHALIYTSNGQTHHHWTPQEFRNNLSRLSKLQDRVLVVVETDELPIEVRSALFTADRSQMLRNDDALRLEDTVAAFLEGWEELVSINGELVRKALSQTHDGRSTINLARLVGRAFKGLGYGTSSGQTNSRSSGNGSPVHRRPPQAIPLYADPTMIEGPECVTAEIGKTKFLSYTLNAIDSFIPKRARLVISTDQPNLGAREITIGELRRGRVRVSLAIPLAASPGSYIVSARLSNWLKSTGGVGPTLEWSTTLDVVEHVEAKPARSNGTGHSDSTAIGDLVPIFWSNPGEDGCETWTAATTGKVEEESAKVIASAKPDYAELATLGDQRIHYVTLNSEYGPLKKYLGASLRDLTDAGALSRRDRYAVGLATGLLYLHVEAKKKAKAKAQDGMSDDNLAMAGNAVARAVLANLPAFDQLAKEAGLEADLSVAHAS